MDGGKRRDRRASIRYEAFMTRYTRPLLTALFCAPFWAAALPAFADPVRFAPDALQQDGRITLTPGFSPDGRTLYMAQSDCTPIWECPQRLKRSVLTDGVWSAPETVPLPRGVGPGEPRADYPSVTPNGTRLLFSWSGQLETDARTGDFENFDLFSLDLTDPEARPERLVGPDLNRVRQGRVKTLRYVNNENAPVLTRDGDLYFWSERLDGPGERDIYVARSDGQGGFLRAEALPGPINSAARDDGSWVHPSGRLMLLTHNERGGQGGADLFVSVLEDGAWSDPVNLGPGVNSPAADFAATLHPDGMRIVFTSTRPVTPDRDGILQVWVAAVSDSPPLVDALARAGL
jgi:Tol biopolymer transport system component